MKNGWGVAAGLGMAGLLVAGTPAWATGGSTASDKTASDKSTTSGSTGSTSDTTMGTPSGSTGTSSDSTYGGTAGSTAKDQHASTSASTSMGSNEVTGKVEKFDKTSKELTLSLKVSDTTQVTKDGRSASLTDIKEGDQVRASFSGSGDSLEVTQIEVMSKGSTGSKSKSGGMGSSGSTDTSIPSPTDTGSTGSTPSPTDTGPTGSSGRGY